MLGFFCLMGFKIRFEVGFSKVFNITNVWVSFFFFVSEI